MEAAGIELLPADGIERKFEESSGRTNVESATSRVDLVPREEPRGTDGTNDRTNIREKSQEALRRAAAILANQKELPPSLRTRMRLRCFARSVGT